MEPAPVPLDAATAPTEVVHSFDIVQAFLHASIVVQLVVLALLIASILTWGIIIQKSILISREKRMASRFEVLFWSGKSLSSIEKTVASWRPPTAMARMFRSVLREWRLTNEAGAPLSGGGFQDRVQAIMDVEGQREMGRLETNLLFLATIGAAAPFIGLFGTVWGIMNSFTAIAASKDTNLAVVAPGIAEALFATALGLIAAIPAVIFYNKFSNDIAQVGVRMEIFAREFWATISRQLDLKAPVDDGVDQADDWEQGRVQETAR